MIVRRYGFRETPFGARYSSFPRHGCRTREWDRAIRRSDEIRQFRTDGNQREAAQFWARLAGDRLASNAAEIRIRTNMDEPLVRNLDSSANLMLKYWWSIACHRCRRSSLSHSQDQLNARSCRQHRADRFSAARAQRVGAARSFPMRCSRRWSCISKLAFLTPVRSAVPPAYQRDAVALKDFLLVVA
jgi:hypothetical protein